MTIRIIIALVLTLSTTAITIADFRDAEKSHANYDAINYLQSKKIVNGYKDGNFRPENKINRAELVKIVVEATVPASDIYGSYCFSDIKGEAASASDYRWFAKYVCTAKRKNIVSGYADGYFRPANDISFVEAAKIILTGFGYSFELEDTWYEPFVKKLSEKKSIPVTIQNLNKKINRGEMAELIWRMKENIQDKDSVTYHNKKLSTFIQNNSTKIKRVQNSSIENNDLVLSDIGSFKFEGSDIREKPKCEFQEGSCTVQTANYGFTTDNKKEIKVRIEIEQVENFSEAMKKIKLEAEKDNLVIYRTKWNNNNYYFIPFWGLFWHSNDKIIFLGVERSDVAITNYNLDLIQPILEVYLTNHPSESEFDSSVQELNNDPNLFDDFIYEDIGNFSFAGTKHSSKNYFCERFSMHDDCEEDNVIYSDENGSTVSVSVAHNDKGFSDDFLMESIYLLFDREESELKWFNNEYAYILHEETTILFICWHSKNNLILFNIHDSVGEEAFSLDFFQPLIDAYLLKHPSDLNFNSEVGEKDKPFIEKDIANFKDFKFEEFQEEEEGGFCEKEDKCHLWAASYQLDGDIYTPVVLLGREKSALKAEKNFSSDEILEIIEQKIFNLNKIKEAALGNDFLEEEFEKYEKGLEIQEKELFGNKYYFAINKARKELFSVWFHKNKMIFVRMDDLVFMVLNLYKEQNPDINITINEFKKLTDREILNLSPELYGQLTIQEDFYSLDFSSLNDLFVPLLRAYFEKYPSDLNF